MIPGKASQNVLGYLLDIRFIRLVQVLSQVENMKDHSRNKQSSGSENQKGEQTTTTIPQSKDSPKALTLHIEMERGSKNRELGFSNGEKYRQVSITTGNWVSLNKQIASPQEKLKRPRIIQWCVVTRQVETGFGPTGPEFSEFRDSHGFSYMERLPGSLIHHQCACLKISLHSENS